MKELAIIERLKTLCPSNASVILGIDDDAAVLRPTARETLICTDMLMEGVHFILAEAGAEAIGRKALAVNLSDIAAMGGKALSAYISLALPKHQTSDAFIQELYRGINTLARRFDVAIAGGDTNVWNGPLVINVTVLGEAHEKGPVLRSGAKIGDTIFVTGPLGGSLEGHHLHFMPRLEEAKTLMDEFDIHSMMDISDGLAKDLRLLAKHSLVAAHIEAQALPLRETIRNAEDPIKRAMTDGEDFELCFTLSPSDAKRLAGDPRFAMCRAIGSMREGTGLYWADEGTVIAWDGYEHGKG